MPFNNIKLLLMNVNGMNNPVKRNKVLTKLKKEKVLRTHFIAPTNFARRGEWLSLSQIQSNLNVLKK